MLYSAKILKNHKLHCLDGEIGTVKEFYFDDQVWTIRYLVADTGHWLTGRTVLISPYALRAVNKEGQFISVDLTKKQIEESPPLSTDKPVSRQFEETYYGHYGWPTYWSGPFMMETYSYPMSPAPFGHSGKGGDPNLRSTQHVSGYRVRSSDGEVGHIEDFVIDDKAWAIRYLVIDTSNWWSGKRVVVSPHLVERISWNESKVFITVSRESIKQAPEFTIESLNNREDESRLQHSDCERNQVDRSAPTAPHVAVTNSQADIWNQI